MSTLHDDHACLKESLDRLVDPLEAPADVTDQAIVRGRRIRARRRVITGVVSVVAAGAVVLGIPALADVFPPAGDAPVASGGASETRGWQERDAGPWSLTARQMHRRLMRLLPPDSKTSDVMYRNDDRGPDVEPGPLRGYLVMSLETAEGYGGLNMVFYQPGSVENPSGADPLAPWSLRCPADTVTCRILRDAKGRPRARLMETLDTQGVTVSTVNLRWRDGTVTYLATANSVGEKWGGPATTPEPPLSLRQMLRIAEDETWNEKSSGKD